MSKFKIDTLFVNLVVFLSFFPWVSLGFLNFGSDIQIYPTLGLIVVFPIVIACLNFRGYEWKFKNDRLFKGVVLYVIGALLTAISILFIDGVSYDSLRGIFPYISSVLWVAFASFIARYYSNSTRVCVFICLLIWLMVGLIQFFIDKQFLSFLLNRTVITDDRGVISLGSEPAYFAMTLLAFSFVIYIFGYKKISATIVVLMMILSKSTAVIIPFIICIILLIIIPYLIKGRGRINKIFFFSFLIFLVMLAVYFLTSGRIQISVDDNASRFYKLISMLASLDITRVIVDGSFNIRLTHYAASLSGFFYNFGLPNGTSNWPSFVSSFASQSNIFWNDGLNETTRINSGLGTLLFEGGVFGLMMFVGVYYICTFNIKKSSLKLCTFVSLLIMFLCVYSIKIPYLYVVVMLYVVELNKLSNTDRC